METPPPASIRSRGAILPKEKMPVNGIRFFLNFILYDRLPKAVRTVLSVRYLYFLQMTAQSPGGTFIVYHRKDTKNRWKSLTIIKFFELDFFIGILLTPDFTQGIILS